MLTNVINYYLALTLITQLLKVPIFVLIGNRYAHFNQGRPKRFLMTTLLFFRAFE